MRLRIEIDAERANSALRDPGEQVQRGGGLADATLLVEYRDDRHRTSLQEQFAHPRDGDFGQDDDREDREQDERDTIPLKQVERRIERHADAAGADETPP